MECTILKPVRNCGQELSHHFLKRNHMSSWPESQAVEAAAAAATQRERMNFSARLASLSRNVGMSSGSLNPENPVHLRPLTACVQGICGSTAQPVHPSDFNVQVIECTRGISP